ncbi:hypothetical protein [Leptolyngbya sp. 7M]|uniref:hypothetical protein n=1 Tax=Leptolyngbya sp. 7M TaxID=2812896 RepID=UPI001B8D108C|nr:hypothetical protein [Leptolyngbya sp. 7M]QYO65211.1 hypothetical protein JVX88_00040 [Leptolyngbya sp. 7M]
MSFISLAVTDAAGQDSRIALQRGYRTGYSDGYMAGYRDSIDNLAKNASRHKEFTDADRAYSREFGSMEDYRDGYRQGFSVGYSTGFEKLAFDSTVPQNLAKKGLAATEASKDAETVIAAMASTEAPNNAEVVKVAETFVKSDTAETKPEPVIADVEATDEPAPAVNNAKPAPILMKASYIPSDDPIIIIPRDTELIIELEEDMSTESSRDGDRFTAKVVSPIEIAGATIEGRIERIQKPGRLKRRSQIDLAFDRIVLNRDRWSNFGGILTEVLPVRGDNVRSVDNEGTAIGKSSVKDDSVRIGAATGVGLGIGAIAGGPVGAAIGAGVGAAYGVGASMVERGKHIRLNRNQQLKIRATYETKIR